MERFFRLMKAAQSVELSKGALFVNISVNISHMHTSSTYVACTQRVKSYDRCCRFQQQQPRSKSFEVSKILGFFHVLTKWFVHLAEQTILLLFQDIIYLQTSKPTDWPSPAHYGESESNNSLSEIW